MSFYTGLIGFGLFPFGVNPFGYGLFPAATPTNITPWLDPITNKPQDARLIDPVIGDYVINQYGFTAGMPSTEQQVLLAVKTQLGSASIQSLGVDYKSAKTTNYDLGAIVNNGLAPLVKAGQIVIVSTTPVVGQGGNMAVIIKYIDVSTNQVRTVNYGS